MSGLPKACHLDPLVLADMLVAEYDKRHPGGYGALLAQRGRRGRADPTAAAAAAAVVGGVSGGGSGTGCVPEAASSNGGAPVPVTAKSWMSLVQEGQAAGGFRFNFK